MELQKYPENFRDSYGSSHTLLEIHNKKKVTGKSEKDFLKLMNSIFSKITKT